MNRSCGELYTGLLSNFFLQVVSNDVHHRIYLNLKEYKHILETSFSKIPDIIKESVILKVYDAEELEKSQIRPNIFYIIMYGSQVVSMNLHISVDNILLVIKQLTKIDTNWMMEGVFMSTVKEPTGFNLMKKYILGKHFTNFVILGKDDWRVKLVFRQVNKLPVEYYDLRNNPVFMQNILEQAAYKSMKRDVRAVYF